MKTLRGRVFKHCKILASAKVNLIATFLADKNISLKC